MNNNTIIALSTVGILSTLNLFFNTSKNKRKLKDKQIKIIDNNIKLNNKEINNTKLKIDRLKKKKSKLWSKPRCMFLEENISKQELKRVELECENQELIQNKNDLIYNLDSKNSKKENLGLDKARKFDPNNLGQYIQELRKNKPAALDFLNDLYDTTDFFIFILNRNNHFISYDTTQELEGFNPVYYTEDNFFNSLEKKKYLNITFSLELSLESPDIFYKEFVDKLQNIYNLFTYDEYQFIDYFIRFWKLILKSYLKSSNFTEEEIQFGKNYESITLKNYTVVKDKNNSQLVSITGNNFIAEGFKSVNPIFYID